jgi:hypothetical protein
MPLLAVRDLDTTLPVDVSGVPVEDEDRLGAVEVNQETPP